MSDAENQDDKAPGFFEIFGLLGKQAKSKRIRRGLREAFQTLGGSAPAPPPPTIRESGSGPDPDGNNDYHRNVSVAPAHDSNAAPTIQATLSPEMVMKLERKKKSNNDPDRDPETTCHDTSQ